MGKIEVNKLEEEVEEVEEGEEVKEGDKVDKVDKVVPGVYLVGLCLGGEVVEERCRGRWIELILMPRQVGRVRRRRGRVVGEGEGRVEAEGDGRRRRGVRRSSISPHPTTIY